MAAIIAILPVLLPLLAQIPGDISALIAWINSLRATAQQSGEWTPEVEAAFLASIAADYKAPEQQVDQVVNNPIPLFERAR